MVQHAFGKEEELPGFHFHFDDAIWINPHVIGIALFEKGLFGGGFYVRNHFAVRSRHELNTAVGSVGVINGQPGGDVDAGFDFAGPEVCILVPGDFLGTGFFVEEVGLPEYDVWAENAFNAIQNCGMRTQVVDGSVVEVTRQARTSTCDSKTLSHVTRKSRPLEATAGATTSASGSGSVISISA